MAVTNEVQRYMNMTPVEMKKLEPAECGEASAILNQSSLYIQLQINTLQARINWCKSSIDFIIANSISQVGTKYTPYEYRRVLAIRNDDAAMKFQTLIVETQLRIDALAFLPTQLRNLATSFESLQRAKGART